MPSPPTQWTVYLAGEIHSNWRRQIETAAEAAGLPVVFTSPVTDHDASDRCGAAILGDQDDPFWFDHIGAKVNAIRTRTFLNQADIVVVRFGEKYRQWNAAFDAGFAAALGTPLIIMHDPEHRHALKEVDSSAQAVATTPEQVVQLLTYAIEGRLD